MNWTFDQGKNVAAIISRKVVEDGLPILQVLHYSDDHSWAFMCGTTSDPDDYMLVSMEQAVRLDNSLYDVSDLAPGWIAVRESREGDWHRTADEDI